MDTKKFVVTVDYDAPLSEAGDYTEKYYPPVKISSYLSFDDIVRQVVMLLIAYGHYCWRCFNTFFLYLAE